MFQSFADSWLHFASSLSEAVFPENGRASRAIEHPEIRIVSYWANTTAIHSWEDANIAAGGLLDYSSVVPLPSMGFS